MEKLCEKTISVIGLGVVGLTTAVGFALKGHRVIGIDITPEKVMGIADGSINSRPMQEAAEQLAEQLKEKEALTLLWSEALLYQALPKTR